MRGSVRTALLTAIRGSASRVATWVPGRGAVLLGALLLQFPVAPRPSGPHSFDRRVFDDPEGEPSEDSAHREFYFTRAVYTGLRRRNWAIDYPKADRQLMVGVRRLLDNLDAFESEHPVRLDDPELRRFPFLYAVEVGHMAMTDAEVDGLRRYLQAGGFLVVDDFWGSWEWAIFDEEIHRVLPGCTIVDLPRDHPVFSAFYDIRAFQQVPNVMNAMTGQTWEKDGYTPHYRGIFDDKGRLLVAINNNTDLGDAWEWAERPEYPLKYSTFAYQMAVNLIVYGMSH